MLQTRAVCWFADVFSYDEDNMVEDPHLSKHLAHFGINITQMEKVPTRILFLKFIGDFMSVHFDIMAFMMCSISADR